MTSSDHPDPEALGRFVLGRLDRRTMVTIEGHLREGCAQCGRVAMQVPDDRLVRLLQVSTTDPASPALACHEASCR